MDSQGEDQREDAHDENANDRDAQQDAPLDQPRDFRELVALQDRFQGNLNQSAQGVGRDDEADGRDHFGTPKNFSLNLRTAQSAWSENGGPGPIFSIAAT